MREVSGWRAARDLPSYAGRTVVVTGGNSGIGRAVAARLAERGAAVTIACRNVEAGRAAAADLREETGAEVEVAGLDLASLASVAHFAASWDGPLDLLVNNAGVMTPPRYRETEDGFELQLGTNHLGHFALTGRLLPHLLAAAAPRVVTVSSIAHHRGRADVLEGNPRRGYQPERAYGNSKLANVLFALELQRRADAHGAALVSTAAHPGVAATNLVASEQGLGSIPGVRRVAPYVMPLLFQSAEAGAEPVLHAASAAGPGSYSGPQRLRESRGPAGRAKLSRPARDPRLAEKLWAMSEELTGVGYPWP
jgi:NAD(P)-dependent dehydrogenase (short-subunit alcohol dehydrogenase family)